MSRQSYGGCHSSHEALRHLKFHWPLYKNIPAMFLGFKGHFGGYSSIVSFDNETSRVKPHTIYDLYL